MGTKNVINLFNYISRCLFTAFHNSFLHSLIVKHKYLMGKYLLKLRMREYIISPTTLAGPVEEESHGLYKTCIIKSGLNHNRDLEGR